MNRNLKALALALAAVFALSAIVASTAAAEEEEGAITSTGPVSITGEDTTGTMTTLTGFGDTIECAVKETQGKRKETPHKFANAPLFFVTVKKDPTKCKAKIGGTTASATITPNKCDFVRFFRRKQKTETKFQITTEEECEGLGEAIEIHVYSSEAHTTTICTIKVPAQAGLVGGTAENISGGKIRMSGTVTGIHASKTGILCGGTAETNTAEEDFNVEVSGANEAGGSTEISLSS